MLGQVILDEATPKPDWRNAWVNLIPRIGGPGGWLPGEIEADGSFIVPEAPAGDYAQISA